MMLDVVKNWEGFDFAEYLRSKGVPEEQIQQMVGMSISKNNESSSGLTEDENGQVVDLRQVMRQYDEMGL